MTSRGSHRCVYIGHKGLLGEACAPSPGDHAVSACSPHGFIHIGPKGLLGGARTLLLRDHAAFLLTLSRSSHSVYYTSLTRVSVAGHACSPQGITRSPYRNSPQLLRVTPGLGMHALTGGSRNFHPMASCCSCTSCIHPRHGSAWLSMLLPVDHPVSVPPCPAALAAHIHLSQVPTWLGVHGLAKGSHGFGPAILCNSCSCSHRRMRPQSFWPVL
jgi:hypothetical protein